MVTVTDPLTARLEAAIKAWSDFFSDAEHERLDPAIFADQSQTLFANHPLAPVPLADLLLRPTPSNRECVDQRTLQYLQVLQKQGRITTAAVLRALYKYSTAHTRAQTPDGKPKHGAGDSSTNDADVGGSSKADLTSRMVRWRNSYMVEEDVLWRLARAVNHGTGIKTSHDVTEVAKVLARWTALFAEVSAAISRDAFNSMNGLQVKDESEDARNAFVLFYFAFCENQLVNETLSQPVCKDICRKLLDSLDAFLPTLMHLTADITGRLEHFRSEVLARYAPQEKKSMDMPSFMNDLSMSLESFQVPELPVVNTRAGLYIYLGAALVGRPMIDDEALFSYLHNRYQGDLQAMAVHLILASFDLLANAVFRNEGAKTGHLLKSFLINKVPLILVQLVAYAATTMYPFNAEMCITEALNQVDINMFPTLSGMFDMPNNNSFNDSVRQDFCFACQLHGLLSQAAIETLLGDITYQSLPPEGRYVKEQLVQACLQEPDRTLKLIGELDNMNGNVGAAAQAIVEICRDLASKPLSLDVLLLFDKPHKILHPLCELLDNWAGYEEDHGEYQPVYEEFGSVLLLLLAFVYRYNLSTADLGIRSSGSFVAKLLNGVDRCQPLEQLSEQEKSHLGGWIHGLFDTEAGGLGDELMSSCPPQDFYLLAPTLFHQIVNALSAGYLTDEMLKGGLEYLVDVLLLPALVPALLYLSNLLWADNQPIQNAVIKILQPILKPTSISNEASTMLSSVLNIVAKPLEHALKSYQRQDPECQKIEPLLLAIADNLAVSRRTGGADHTELESWCSAQITNPATGALIHGGLAAAVRTTIQQLVQWAQNPTLNSMNGMPAPYTHRQTLAAQQILGPHRLLGIILDELKSSPEPGIAYDVVTTMICAPDVRNSTISSPSTQSNNSSDHNDQAQNHQSQDAKHKHPHRLTLRDALRLEAHDFRAHLRADPVLAETVVRLYRRVEAQLTPLALPLPPAAAAAPAVGVNVGVDAATAAAAAAAAAMMPDALGLGVVGGVELGGMEGAIAAAVAAANGSGTGGAGGDGTQGGAGDAGMGLDGQQQGQGGSSAGDMGLGGGTADDIFSGLSGPDDFGADFGSWSMDLS
ncbi:uncharacterized protein CTHT_0065900 [Thermochaetoides thermophila DSM 1495]|uniref:Mediator of RNA polymerase II transcription subunit 5 n=1 Tax=Chaetomium thermophilum (strain DSM 1495 / CBS 144.50 / IMI 039719) TaxID=759272 RepID=G0SGD2_CHATD|nr:hypothetical protein CTHT_0065900 [Thermochaetoides thermophila DSM 1495]EGS17271.1 hypothetical protein CTHT_0065900 [Thermochaetoides thermophila DSM 1495]